MASPGREHREVLSRIDHCAAAFGRKVAAAAREAAIGKRVTPHTFGHSFATHRLAAAGA